VAAPEKNENWSFPMIVSERRVEDVTILDIDGRITVQDGADVLRDCIQRAIAQGHSKLVLNCGNVPYIDTTAISEIVRGYTTLTRGGGSLKLLNLTPHVHRLLSITKLLAVFQAFTDERAAVESFKTASL
jgi:anti-sigma B factor antagonist